jgi:rhodanese-related sulfurtransferase
MSNIKELAPQDAWNAMQAASRHLFLDVRDRVEYAMVGHPLGAINIPWKIAPDWRPNPDFVREIKSRGISPGTPVFLLCRSGQRSLEAAQALASEGFQDLTNITEGFEGGLDAQKHRSTVSGWRFRGLPWEQS